jgi:dinuclear metal center YbgI/SA1388 family protein
MAAVKDVFQALDRLAPFGTQLDFDNAGFLAGRSEREVRKILVALDITQAVAEEAGRWGADLIVSHHPVIFHPVKAVTDRDETGRVLLALIENRISAICAHTNLDAAQGGVNDRLAAALELASPVPFEAEHIGRMGQAHRRGLPVREYAAFVKDRLNAAGVRFVDGGRPVEQVAVGGGSCGSMLHEAVESGCDTFVTADVKYDVFLEAKALGLNLLDAGHYATEQVVCPALVDFLQKEFPAVQVRLSEVHREVYESV